MKILFQLIRYHQCLSFILICEQWHQQIHLQFNTMEELLITLDLQLKPLGIIIHLNIPISSFQHRFKQHHHNPFHLL